MASTTQPKRPAGGAFGQFMNDKRAEFDKDLEAFEAAGGVKEKIARKGKDGKVKKAKDPDAPKRPAGGAYGVFLAENRDEIIKTLPKG